MKPYVICHMVTSVDGKILGDRWGTMPGGTTTAELFESTAESFGIPSWLVGTTTMREFMGKDVPLERTRERIPREDHLAQPKAKRFAIGADARGVLRFQSGYVDEEHVVLLVTERVSNACLAHLRKAGASYLFCGRDEVDLPTALYITAAQVPHSTIVGQLPVQQHPEQFGLVLPHGSSLTPCVTQAVNALRKNGITNFYWQYFQAPGVAEREFERDVDFSMRAIVGRGFTDPAASLFVEDGKGFLGDPAIPRTLPDWIGEEELAYFVETYRASGFRGGFNWYRNIDRNWELTAPWHGAQIQQPALFIAGSKDSVITGLIGAKRVGDMERVVPNLTRKLIVEGAGHWIQQERPAEVNAALIAFLEQVSV